MLDIDAIEDDTPWKTGGWASETIRALIAEIRDLRAVAEAARVLNTSRLQIPSEWDALDQALAALDRKETEK